MRGVIFSLTAQRDKVVDNHIAGYLRALGHEVEVHGYIHNARQSVPYLKPDFVVIPMVGGQFKLDFAKKCKEWGVEVIVRRGEAGVTKEQYLALPKERQKIIIGNWDYSDCVDLELTWSWNFADLLAEFGTMPRKKLVPCGGFAFDEYFRPPGRKMSGKRAVLFATGFSCGDTTHDSPECGLPKDDPFQKELQKAGRQGRDKWIASIKRICGHFGDSWVYYLKVRPGEMTQEYRDAFRDVPVKILDQGFAASDALRMVDLVVHTGSTMAIEAHLLGIPTLNFHNMNPDRKLAAVCPQIRSCAELIEEMHVTDLSTSNIIDSVYHEVVTRLYDGEIDGKACERAANAIFNHLTMLKFRRNEKGQKRPEIPDAWPLEPDYLKAPAQLEELKKTDIKWMCPACPGKFFTPEGEGLADCPFCGMTIEYEIVKVVYGEQGPKRIDSGDKAKGGASERHVSDNRSVRAGPAERSPAKDSKKVPRAPRPVHTG